MTGIDDVRVEHLTECFVCPQLRAERGPAGETAVADVDLGRIWENPAAASTTAGHVGPDQSMTSPEDETAFAKKLGVAYEIVKCSVLQAGD